MTNLGEALERYQAKLNEVAPAVLPRLSAGLDPALVRRRLHEKGFRAPAEIVEWFAWRDGDEDDVARLTPDLGKLTLETALGYFEEYDGHGPWLPILQGGEGSVMVVDCSPEADDTLAAVSMIDRDGGEYYDILRIASLHEIVNWWADQLTSGVWTWNGQGLRSKRTPELKARFPEAAIKMGLVF